MSQVSSASSPVPGGTGVKITTTDGTTVYALLNSTASQKAAGLTIKSAARADIDTSGYLGKVTYEFGNIPADAGAIAVIDAPTPVGQVLECNPARQLCDEYPFERISPTRVSFVVRNDFFYALLP